MEKIILHRPPGYTDIFRAYEILLDGQPIGNIKRGESVEFDVEQGEHVLQLRIDWLTSNTEIFHTMDGPAKFTCGSNFDGKKILLAAIYLFSPKGDYLWLKRN